MHLSYTQYSFNSAMRAHSKNKKQICPLCLSAPAFLYFFPLFLLCFYQHLNFSCHNDHDQGSLSHKNELTLIQVIIKTQLSKLSPGDNLMNPMSSIKNVMNSLLSVCTIFLPLPQLWCGC